MTSNKVNTIILQLNIAYQNITSVYGKHMGSYVEPHCTLDSIVVVTPTDFAGILIVLMNSCPERRGRTYWWSSYIARHSPPTTIQMLDVTAMYDDYSISSSRASGSLRRRS